jgi:hypothetical protein
MPRSLNKGERRDDKNAKEYETQGAQDKLMIMIN